MSERLRVAIEAAAKRLRMGVEGPHCADELEGAFMELRLAQLGETLPMPKQLNSRGEDGSFRTVYLFDNPREQGMFQARVKQLFQAKSE